MNTLQSAETLSDSFPQISYTVSKSRKRQTPEWLRTPLHLAESVSLQLKRVIRGHNELDGVKPQPFTSYDKPGWRSWHERYMHRQRQKQELEKAAVDTTVGVASAAIIYAVSSIH